MKKTPIFIIITVVFSYSCRNKLIKTDEKSYVTTLKGFNGQSLSNAKITAGEDTATSVSGKYFISVIHNGSFTFTKIYDGNVKLYSSERCLFC